jgi:hypothetical protein
MFEFIEAAPSDIGFGGPNRQRNTPDAAGAQAVKRAQC